MTARTEYPISFVRKRRRIWVARSVTEVWSDYAQHGPSSPEACGVLIGATTDDWDEIWIERATPPLAADTQRRTTFRLEDPGHQSIVDAHYAATGGSHIYLGTWHTHPERRPRPSRVDTRDWRACRRRNPGRNLVFAIVGTQEIALFENSYVGYRKMNTPDE